MVSREAMEFFENDPNPYAVDPRLTAESKPSAGEPVLEYAYRLPWKVCFQRISAFLLFFLAFFSLYMFLFHFLTGIPFRGFGAYAAPAVGGLVGGLIGTFIPCRLRIDRERVEWKIGWNTKRFETPTAVFRPVKRRWWNSWAGFQYPIEIVQGRGKKYFPCRSETERLIILQEIDAFIKEYCW